MKMVSKERSKRDRKESYPLERREDSLSQQRMLK
jgi:hypothetical protein